MTNYILNAAEIIARYKTCLAVDVSKVSDAIVLAKEVSGLVGFLKIGKETHTSACNEGISIIKEMCQYGGGVFLDLKFHDTPQTVYGAAKAATVPGVSIFNIHVAGGEMMCKKAIEGATEEAEVKKIGRPRVIGVTVLTSLNDKELAKQGLGIKYDDWVKRNTELAKKWGLDGVVCPANKAGTLEKEFGKWLYVTPGIEWKGKSGLGQQQLYTPDKAVQDCKSSILVIGSAITKAQDKRKTAYEILQAMAPYV
jgi:orotidine-5'-phosphate decarboxylase